LNASTNLIFQESWIIDVGKPPPHIHGAGKYEGVCLNPKDIPPDDLDDVILARMIKEAGI